MLAESKDGAFAFDESASKEASVLGTAAAWWLWPSHVLCKGCSFQALPLERSKEVFAGFEANKDKMDRLLVAGGTSAACQSASPMLTAADFFMMSGEPELIGTGAFWAAGRIKPELNQDAVIGA